MKKLLMCWLGLHSIAWAEDPDLGRAVPEGQVVFTGDPLPIEATARAYLVHYQGYDKAQVSPSRYTVKFDAGEFRFRNASAHPIPAKGEWMEVVFKVHGVSETAVEEPAGSNNWTWKFIYECDLISLEPAG